MAVSQWQTVESVIEALIEKKERKKKVERVGVSFTCDCGPRITSQALPAAPFGMFPVDH